MKAAIFLGNKTFRLEDRPLPDCAPGQVLIRNRAAGVCGTDVHIFHGEPGSADVNPPVVLGHEYAGEVVAVGEGVADLKPGDHVAVDPNIYCGACAPCRTGKKQLCPHMEAVGVTMDGGFAEYSLVPYRQAIRVDSSVPFEHAAMMEPLACCLHGIDRAEIRPGQSVCVVGGGAIGLLMVQLARLSGASCVILSEPNALRRSIALEVGADLCVDPFSPGAVQEVLEKTGGGADVLIECAGNGAAVRSCFEMAAKGATVLLFSVPKADASYPLALFPLYQKELTVKGSFVNPDTNLRAVRLLEGGRLRIDPLITHRYPLEGTQDAILMQQSDESVKVMVKP